MLFNWIWGGFTEWHNHAYLKIISSWGYNDNRSFLYDFRRVKASIKVTYQN